MSSQIPMLILWGPEFTQFYNDSFLPFARAHFKQHGLGKSVASHWRKSWPALCADVQDVMDGKAVAPSQCRGSLTTDYDNADVHHFDYSLSPIFDEDRIGGVLIQCQTQVAAQRQNDMRNQREVDLIRVQQIGNFGGLEVVLNSGFQNRRSPEYLLLHGLPPEACNESHENWVSRIHPEDRYRTENAFIEAVAGDSKGYSIQYRIIRPGDGKIRWIRAKTEIERRSDGSAIRLVGAHVDVTDQIDVDFLNRAQFTAALDVLRCAVMLVCPNGDILYANATATRMLAEGSFVRIRSNRISFVSHSARTHLNELLKNMAHAPAKGASFIKLSDLSPVVAHIVPLACTELQSRVFPAIAAIFIREQDDNRSSATLLATTYGLTLAETKVLYHLVRGHSLSEIARQLNVANSTVRTQLNVIFRKTGVNRQSELILFASQLTSPIRD